ncbi:MAG: zinc-dependent metalloprotease [Bacteroidia bacterium]
MRNFLLLSTLLFSTLLVAQPLTKLTMGSPKNVLNDIRNQHTRAADSYSLPLTTGEVSVIKLDNYYFDEIEGLSMNGARKDSPKSIFILKGDRTSLYGYLLMDEERKAFEITTTDGIVSMQEVAITKINPDLYGEEIIPIAPLAPRADVEPVYSPMANRQVIHIGKYNNEDVTKLESKPGSSYVFYLNMAAVMDGNTPKNNRTKEETYRIWQSAADQYSMYNMNVTTNLAVYNAAKSANVSRTGIMGFANADGRSNAPLSSFGTTSAGTLYRNALHGEYGYGLGMTCSHEMGHQMGMSHDGGSAQTDPEYFFGLPDVQWCPIMGNYWRASAWNNQLFQWSKGEYNTSTNKEDDLRIMASKVPYMKDDIATTKAIEIDATGVISSDKNWGQIAENTDTDTFTFEVASEGGGGVLNLRIDPIEYLRQLDVQAKIVDSKGVTIATSNLPVNRSAEFKNLNLTGGTYSLVIQGGGELTSKTGFSNYSSLGFYAMQGTLSGSVVSDVKKVSLEKSISTFPNPATDILNISYARNSADMQITLINVTGETVFSANQLLKSIDMSKFSKGIYFLKFTSQGESVVKKVSKL